MPTYTFNELLHLWKDGFFSIEEVMDPIFQTIDSFKTRTSHLDFKLLPLLIYTNTPVNDEEVATETLDDDDIKILGHLPFNLKTACLAIDQILEKFAVMEMKLIKMERDYERMARQVDTTNSIAYTLQICQLMGR